MNVSIDEAVVLFSAAGTEIVEFEMPSNSMNSIYTSNRSVSYITYDNEQKRLMWLEYGHDTVYSYDIQHSTHNATTIAAKSDLVTGLTSISTFAYDWITKSIIWSSKAERKVYVTSLDDAQCTLLQLPESMTPSSIVVDPFRQ